MKQMSSELQLMKIERAEVFLYPYIRSVIPERGEATQRAEMQREGKELSCCALTRSEHENAALLSSYRTKQMVCNVSGSDVHPL